MPPKEPARRRRKRFPGAGRSTPARPKSSHHWLGVALFFACLALYLSNGRTLPFAEGGDSLANRLLPFSVLRFGTLTLDPFREAFAANGAHNPSVKDNGGYPWWVRQQRGHLVSFYPIGTSIVVLPFYAPLFLLLLLRGQTDAGALFAASQWCEKAVAATLAATTVWITWRALRERTEIRRATGIAAVLGAGTLLWPVASQELWPHGPGALLVAIMLWLLQRTRGGLRALCLGLAAGMAFAVRFPTGVFGAAAAVALLLPWPEARPVPQRLRDLALFCAAAVPIALAVLLYNYHYYDHWAGGYSLALGLASGWRERLLSGTAGLLLSPNRGLLVYMPVAAFGIAGAFVAVRRFRAQAPLVCMLLASVAYGLAHAISAQWAGGWCFGPRFLIEVLPILAIAATLALDRLTAWKRTALALAIVGSFFIQASGAYCYPASRWNVRMSPDLEAKAWDWRHFMPWEDFVAWRRAPG